MTYKFYCPNCRYYVFGPTIPTLADLLNTHNRSNHPFEKNDWDADDIVQSSHFERCEDAPGYITKNKPDAMVVAQPLPVKLDEDDDEWLTSLGVKW